MLVKQIFAFKATASNKNAYVFYGHSMISVCLKTPSVNSCNNKNSCYYEK